MGDRSGAPIPVGREHGLAPGRGRTVRHSDPAERRERCYGGGDQLTEDLETPFRILPSRGLRLHERADLIASTVLFVAVLLLAVAVSHAVSATELIAVSLLFGSILAVIGFLLIRRQRRRLGRYWLELDRDQLTIVMPDSEQTYEWHNLTRFVIEEDERTTTNSEQHVMTSVTVYVCAVDAGPNSRRIQIVADDFAAKLPGNHSERAQRFCAILNDLRGWAADPAHHVLSRRSVSGLAIAAGHSQST